MSRTSPSITAPKKATLGRLKSFGLDHVWQVPFLLPKGYDDLRIVHEGVNDLMMGTRVAIRGPLVSAPNVSFDPPKMSASIRLSTGQRVGFTFFGDTRALQTDINQRSDCLVLLGRLVIIHDRLWLSDPELVDDRWVGHCRPYYQGLHRVITPSTVRERVLGLLDTQLPKAAAWLEERLIRSAAPAVAQVTRDILKLQPQEPSINRVIQLLRQAHRPGSRVAGERALMALERLAALGIYNDALLNRPKGRSAWTATIDPTPWISGAPFPLTPDQVAAIEAGIADLAKLQPGRRLILGDVGTGKTFVGSAIAAACAHAGGRVVILMPGEALAEQFFRELRDFFPVVADRCRLLTGRTKVGLTELDEAAIVVGTTALLHRHIEQVSLLICDEQQKFAVGQREKLTAGGAHLIEMTATCIPRTQALARYGVVETSRLTTCPVEKAIETRIWSYPERVELFGEVQRTLAAASQVLVIYPVRESSTDKDGLPSAAEAFEQWDAIFPGQVALAHGGLSSADNEDAISSVRNGSKDVLVSTSLVEVGMNIPNLRRVVVVHPERFGAVQLHQIRGRVARTGGQGWCDLYLPREPSEDTMERLQILVDCPDGFSVAERDLALRGFGSLSRNSDRQSGADGTFLFGRPLSLRVMDETIERVSAAQRGC